MAFKHTKAGLVSASILSALMVAAVGCSKAQNANGNIDVTLKYTPTIEEATVSPTPNPQSINPSHVITGPGPIVPVNTQGITLTPSATNVMEPTPK
jgi:hypothetical protein